jgi:hypothetical protein
MADLMLHEPLSLEELEAETCVVLPERDLMQNVVVAGQGQANLAGDFGVQAGSGIGIFVLVVPGP